MDTAAVILQVIGFLPRFLPKPKPPVFDYGELRAAAPYNRIQIPESTKIEPVTSVHPGLPESPAPAEKPEVGTACIACSRSHLSTVSGVLNEALRFAREEGIKSSPEVLKRLFEAEDQINAMERLDLSAEALQKSPPQEAQVAREYLPRIRQLRQDIGQVTSVEELEKTAADASVLGQEFRLRALQLKGVDLNPVLALAKRVQAHEITMDEAKAQLKKLLPEEE